MWCSEQCAVQHSVECIEQCAGQYSVQCIEQYALQYSVQCIEQCAGLSIRPMGDSSYTEKMQSTRTLVTLYTEVNKH